MNFLRKAITLRSILGTYFLLILIGEPNAAFRTNIFTPGTFLIFSLFYFVLFHVFDSLIYRYKLVLFQVILLTFAIYSVFVTGFLNKELTEYILQPNIFITLIRIQASFFVVFAFYLLNKILPRNERNVLSIKQATVFAFACLLLISTGGWGIPNIFKTFQIAPFFAIVFLVLMILAITKMLSYKPKPKEYKNKGFTLLAIICFVCGMIPSSIPAFVALLFFMISGGLYILFNKNARNHPL